MSNFKIFKKRDLLIATNHKKEKVIAPILEKELEVKCFVYPDFDTDKFGSFTGEVQRKDDPITTVKNKCLMAMELANCDLAVASEGSFGPHPTIFFMPADEEFLIFIDKKNDLEIIVRELSMETNYNALEISTERELYRFAEVAKFPSHALIIKKGKDDFSEIVKGIITVEHLNTVFHHFVSRYGKAFVETDMRAMYNPTRMKVIKKATLKLTDTINSFCPKCQTPGFTVTAVKQGLPCELCGFPTRSTLSFIYTCSKCAYTKEEKYPNAKFKESSMYCDICNP